MAERIQIGAAIISAIMVTQRELRTNGLKPNFPDIGFHSLEKSISFNE
jgi:hypothetical protein